MSNWNLKDKHGKYRSRKAFKKDCSMQSQEPWELRTAKKVKKTSKRFLKRVGNMYKELI